MQVSFAHANLHQGNETTLLRFETSVADQNPCLLIDSGRGVNVDDLLTADDELVGIILTHAHRDHYLSLGHNLRDDAPVYAAPGTAAVLDSVLEEGSRYQYLGETDEVVARLEAVESWTDVHEMLRIHPMPAGHAPGAAAFAIQFREEEDWKTIIATGDFTQTRSAGYPAMPDDLLLDVGAVLLTGATSEYDDRAQMLETVVERSIAGSCVLVTATGLSCVEYAYLVGHLCERLQHGVDITIAGQAAKLYEELEYDVPNVQAVTEFESTKEVLSRGGITIAGPQVPTEGASGRLFESIRDSGTATLVQMTDGAGHPVEAAGCTTYSYRHVAHPTEAEVDALVANYNPASVVVTHQRGADLDRYKEKEYASFVWATEDTEMFTLYDGCWKAPPWVTHAGHNQVLGQQTDQRCQQSLIGNPPLPSLERADGVDFAAEGINLSETPFLARASPQ